MRPGAKAGGRRAPARDADHFAGALIARLERFAKVDGPGEAEWRHAAALTRRIRALARLSAASSDGGGGA